MAKKVSIICRLVRQWWDAEFTVVESGAAPDTDIPLAGAVVTVGSRQATTGADGKATLSPFKAGTYDFSVALADFDDYTGSFKAG